MIKGWGQKGRGFSIEGVSQYISQLCSGWNSGVSCHVIMKRTQNTFIQAYCDFPGVHTFPGSEINDYKEQGTLDVTRCLFNTDRRSFKVFRRLQGGGVQSSWFLINMREKKTGWRENPCTKVLLKTKTKQLIKGGA